MQYPIHGKRQRHKDIKGMIDSLREAAPNLKFWLTGEVIAENNYVFGSRKVEDLILGLNLMIYLPESYLKIQVGKFILQECPF